MSKNSLEEYLASGVENIVKGGLKASLVNPRESLFMTKYAIASRKFTKIRSQAAQNGKHIPPFLIASITSYCNLHCAGCYSRAIDSCNDAPPEAQLDAETWGKLFQEAASLGIGFVILAGGEPLLREDVLQKAAEQPDILFPVITNGTMLNESYITLFDKHRNLLPILSIEGGHAATDGRRGSGIYHALSVSMESLQEHGILFGVSITVTTRNLQEVLSREFNDDLHRKGCRVILLIEYVAAAEGTDDLAPGAEERSAMDRALWELRRVYDDMIFLSFPGDEKEAGGCLASGRGFFHINSHGGAEPCPFSPCSAGNVVEISIAGALESGLFQALRGSDLLSREHSGGCALFGKDDQVRALAQEK